MRILITGSSGQIGTNLALRLLSDGHEVFGVDKRRNTWTDEFPTLLQDLAGHYAPFPGGINGVEYPETDLVVHLAGGRDLVVDAPTPRCTSWSASRTGRSRTP